MKKQMKISAIGDGTTTGAISSLNSNLGNKASYITFPTNINEKRTIYILADVTDWYNGIGYSNIYFAGHIFASREGYSISSITEVTASVTYQNNGKDSTYNLTSSSDNFIPCILKHTTNDGVSYKLALKFNQVLGGYAITFLGFISYIGTINAISYPTSQNLPDGYEMMIEGGHSYNNRTLTYGIGSNISSCYTYDSIKTLENNTKLNGKHYRLGWQDLTGWFRIAELFCKNEADSILMEFMFMTGWGSGSTSSIKVEVGWFNRTNIILENTKNIRSTYNELQYTGIRIYKSNDNNNVIYIDLRSPRPNKIEFLASQYSTQIDVYARILDSALKMDDELDTSVYTVLKQIDLTSASDTYTSTLSRISTLESKVSALESSTS